MNKHQNRTGGRRSPMSHVAIILDRSGSMEACREATISGFNEYVQRLRAMAQGGDLDMTVTLTVFNDEVQVQSFMAPLPEMQSLDTESYDPDGMTAMLDAVGRTVDLLVEEIPDADAPFLVCIISDGLENASRVYTYADIAERIQRLQQRGNWTFTYLGSNQDLSQISADLSIPAEQVASYTSSPAGTHRAWVAHAAASIQHVQQVLSAAPSGPFYRQSDIPGDEA